MSLQGASRTVHGQPACNPPCTQCSVATINRRSTNKKTRRKKPRPNNHTQKGNNNKKERRRTRLRQSQLRTSGRLASPATCADWGRPAPAPAGGGGGGGVSHRQWRRCAPTSSQEGDHTRRREQTPHGKVVVAVRRRWRCAQGTLPPTARAHHSRHHHPHPRLQPAEEETAGEAARRSAAHHSIQSGCLVY